MKEFFVFASSFAAPWASDETKAYVAGESGLDALRSFVKKYKHPAGLYFAAVYEYGDDYLKEHDPLARWRSNWLIQTKDASKDLGGYAFKKTSDVSFEINGKRFLVHDPKGGRFEIKQPNGSWL